MTLYVKQDFSPPILSRRWIAMKFRPNMLLYSRHHIISILESGLLFREDSIEVEQETPGEEDVWKAAGGGGGGWLSPGERAMAVLAVGVGVAAFPPRSVNRATIVHVAALAGIPVCVRAAHRLRCRGCLRALLTQMRGYLALARRAAACLRECTALRAQLGSVSSVLESTHTLLCRQQSELAIVMSRASSALLGNAPWLRSDVAWEAIERDDTENLLKIHHAFLVVQSTLLKHIAMAHYIPSPHAQKVYKNHNERIYWIHNTLIKHLTEEFQQNFEALERMYRLLKNYGNNDNSDVKKPGTAITDSWAYSDVHTGIARANLELKLALNKCSNLDQFLDSCALNNQELDLEILNKDIDDLIDDINKSLSTVQSSQIRLKKLQKKVEPELKIEIESNEEVILKIEDKEPESKDEVFYFVKTDDDDKVLQSIGDVTTAPGKKEKEATKVVLNELRRKLVKREDVMRERERQALVKTMPELKDNLPEFPRQINFEEYADKKGYISKLQKNITKKRSFNKYRLKTYKSDTSLNKYKMKTNKYATEDDIKELSSNLYEANSNLSLKSKLLTFKKDKSHILVNKWCKKVQIEKQFYSEESEGLSDVEAGTVNKTVNEAINNNDVSVNSNHFNDARNYRFSKRDLEMTPSSSESDLEFYKDKERQMALLKDVRRCRAARKKNHPDKRANLATDTTVDESLRPVEYSFGTGLAMASILQVNAARIGGSGEEVFVGDGELSADSGNDEDA